MIKLILGYDNDIHSYILFQYECKSGRDNVPLHGFIGVMEDSYNLLVNRY